MTEAPTIRVAGLCYVRQHGDRAFQVVTHVGARRRLVVLFTVRLGHNEIHYSGRNAAEVLRDAVRDGRLP